MTSALTMREQNLCMTPRQLRAKIQALPAHQRLTAAFESALQSRSPSTRPSGYATQKEHWLAWLDGYNGPGAYGRKHWARSAEFVFNHIGCPPMLAWLAEASGLSARQLSAAIESSMHAEPNFAAKCAAFRRVITWNDIVV